MALRAGLSEQSLLDGDGQVGTIDQHDCPWRRGRPDGMRRRCGKAGCCTGRREGGAAAGHEARRACDRTWSGWHTLGHHDGFRSAFFEYDHDTIVPATRGDDVDEVARPGPCAEENADGTHTARLEHIGCGNADAAPQATPFCRRTGEYLLGMAGHR